MDSLSDSYVTLFRNVTKSIENLEKLAVKSKMPEETRNLIEKEISSLKQAQRAAEEIYISQSKIDTHTN